MVEFISWFESFFFLFFFLLLLLQSVFQSPDTEQTGNGMGTSARLALPPDSEAGRIQAILQMRSCGRFWFES